MRVARWLAALTLGVGSGACSMATTRMERALDPSMERTVLAENYLRVVSGISADARRNARGDGYIYLADIAPQLRYMAMTGDAPAYRRLREFAARSLVERDGSSLQPIRRYRGGAPFEPASRLDALHFADALAAGWRAFGDTASAVLAAQRAPLPSLGAAAPATVSAAEQCVNAEAALPGDRARAATVLSTFRRYDRGTAGTSEAAAGPLAGDDRLTTIACLTRLGLATGDPDASVRFLDALLRRLDPMVKGSGRPDAGASADILMTLRLALAAGPKYARQP